METRCSCALISEKSKFKAGALLLEWNFATIPCEILLFDG